MLHCLQPTLYGTRLLSQHLKPIGLASSYLYGLRVAHLRRMKSTSALRETNLNKKSKLHLLHLTAGGSQGDTAQYKTAKYMYKIVNNNHARFSEAKITTLFNTGKRQQNLLDDSQDKEVQINQTMEFPVEALSNSNIKKQFKSLATELKAGDCFVVSVEGHGNKYCGFNIRVLSKPYLI